MTHLEDVKLFLHDVTEIMPINQKDRERRSLMMQQISDAIHTSEEYGENYLLPEYEDLIDDLMKIYYGK